VIVPSQQQMLILSDPKPDGQLFCEVTVFWFRATDRFSSVTHEFSSKQFS